MDDIFRMELDKSETAAPLYQQLADGIARLISANWRGRLV